MFKPLAVPAATVVLTLVLVLAPALLVAQENKDQEESTAPPAEAPEQILVNNVQGTARIYRKIYETATKDNVSIRIDLAKQRAQLLVNEVVAIDTPISTGTKAHPTPKGSFRITEKKLYHESTLYGDFVDKRGRVVLGGVSSRRNKAPPGTRFRGTPVPYWQRLTPEGVGMHVGKLPGSPASHGCLRFPSTVMPLIYEKSKIGTPVVIE